MMIFYLILTLSIYFIAKKLYRRTNHMIFSPLLVCPIIIIGVLLVFQVPYESYDQGGQLLTMMLQPATVALAVPMYKYRKTVKKYFMELAVSVTGGAIVAIVTSMVIASFLGINSQLLASLAPRSITTPIAMSVSELVGGNPSITAVFVICTALLGTILTTALLKYAPIKSPVTKGVLYGISAHGTGTAKAYELGQIEGVIASLAMIFMGIITTFIAPQVVAVCFHFLGGGVF
ncbi:LrgB family protein [Anaerosinus massiliensis]|uniref:LrgB family protein n=1 Tax=Massilibacillus massiliensis TaxID=1806837 RepID=UPI000AE25921|nr:LrgB family protein [Massilibacillus massiliensis]